MNKSQRASETQKYLRNKQQSHLRQGSAGQPAPSSNVPSCQERLAELRSIIDAIKRDINSPFRKPSKGAKSFLKDAIAAYELVLKASLGTPTYSDNSTLQYEGPNDIPTAPLSGLVPVQRTAYIIKNATSGTTAGGFYADLVASDFVPWTSSTTGKYFRVKQVTSWTCNRADGSLTQGTFAGVNVPVQFGSSGTEILPAWSENWEPIGQGFASIVTKFPLGAYPLYSGVSTDTTIICSHFTSLGGTGGVTGVPVVFHVVIESLI